MAQNKKVAAKKPAAKKPVAKKVAVKKPVAVKKTTKPAAKTYKKKYYPKKPKITAATPAPATAMEAVSNEVKVTPVTLASSLPPAIDAKQEKSLTVMQVLSWIVLVLALTLLVTIMF